MVNPYTLKIKFYGTRGSIPICGRDHQDFGGNTTCVSVEVPDSNTINIIDAGTGIRNLGKELMSFEEEMPKRITIGFTHFHWDHIQGFPFFDPVYLSDVNINILAMGRTQEVDDLRNIFLAQTSSAHFPIQLSDMGAEFHFIVLGRKAAQHANGLSVQACQHNHPGGANSYRVEKDGKVLVFCTDIEHGDNLDPNIISLARDADLLIHEAQYTTEELRKRKGWGHSSYEQAIQVAEMANVKQLIMTHHDPDHDDVFLRRMEKLCQDRYQDCCLAREGMEILL